MKYFMLLLCYVIICGGCTRVYLSGVCVFVRRFVYMCQASSNETQREGSMQQYVSNRRPLVSQCNQIVLQMDSSWRSESTLKHTHTHKHRHGKTWTHCRTDSSEQALHCWSTNPTLSTSITAVILPRGSARSCSPISALWVEVMEGTLWCEYREKA